MNTRIYVGNLSYGTTEERLKEVFSGYGEIASTKLITDRETGKFRGFAFVEMATAEAAEAAIKALDGQEVDGRQLRVNEAQERRPASGAGRGSFRGSPRPRYDDE